MASKRRAVVLLSGGLDSATCLALARAEGMETYCLSVDYGQRHGSELGRARRIAREMGAAGHQVVKVGLSTFGGSALTDRSIAVPKGRKQARRGARAEIPATYVPARNTILLSLALAYAETLGAEDLYLGVNAVDYSGYPDCRPAFIAAFERVARLATKAGVSGRPPRIHAPLLRLSKAEIVRLGASLGVPHGLTSSCYDPIRGRACGSCDSCRIRRRGFAEAGIPDPTRYAGA